MGLIYNPTDSQGLVSALNANIRTADEMIESLNRASKHLIDALGNKTLSGAAFTAGKGMFSQLVIPTISKASQALDKLKSDAKQYEGFAANAGEDLLDEDKLNEQLQTLQMQQVALDSQISFFKQLAASHPDDSALNTSYADSSKQLSSFMSTTASDIQNVQDKLKKLHEFNTNVNPLFVSSRGDFKAVVSMVLALGLAEFDKAGNFVLKVVNESDYKKISSNLELFGKLLNPIQIDIHGVKIAISSKDAYKTIKYGQSILRKWEKSPEKFAGRTVFSKAQIKDFKILGKSVLKNDSRVGKIVSKLPSFEHGQVNGDLRIMRENRSNFSAMTKVGKGFKIAGWVGTAVDAGTSAADYKSKGYSNEQVAELTVRKTTVDFAASTTGSTVGRVAGAALGQALIPIPGVGAAVGAVAGGIVGGIVGGWIGGIINDQLDKGVKPKKKGWSWPW